MEQDFDSFYLNKEAPIGECLLALRSLILRQDEQITETRKYGMPCFCYRKKMFCYLWVDKNSDEPYIMMVEGKFLEHPGLEADGRVRMKIFRVHPHEDLPVAAITQVLQDALDLYRNGIIQVKS